MNPLTFYGFPVYVRPSMNPIAKFVQYRFPRSKKKRIQNKWRKNPRNYKVKITQRPEIYKTRNAIICNELGYEIIKQTMPQQ